MIRLITDGPAVAPRKLAPGIPADLETIFSAPHWRQHKHRRFQLGLNHLYVFERTSG